MIAPILQLLPNEQKRCEMISAIAINENISKQTLRKYLCLYLSFQNVAILSPKDNKSDRSLTDDEKNGGLINSIILVTKIASKQRIR